MSRPSKILYVVYHFRLCAQKSYERILQTFNRGSLKNMLIQCCILSDLIRRIYQIIFVRFFSFAKGHQPFKIKLVSIYSQDHPGH